MTTAQKSLATKKKFSHDVYCSDVAEMIQMVPKKELVHLARHRHSIRFPYGWIILRRGTFSIQTVREDGQGLRGFDHNGIVENSGLP